MPEGPPGLPATPTGPLTTPHAGDFPTHPDTPPPARAGGCLIVGELGRGGMGLVYEGEEEALGRRLAVKVLRTDLAGRGDIERRFLAEARLTGQLQHPGVPPIHEVGTLPDGRPFFSMKLVRGRTLEALLRERASAAELPRMLAVFEQVCQTIGYAHSKGIIHRDLKPSNVMVGEFGEVQVMDWGLAKLLGPQGEVREGPEAAAESTVFTPVNPAPDNATRAGTILGTPAYIAPEQARGQTEFLDQRADVFGLGAVLCQILTGEPPYLATGGKAVLRQAQDGDLTSARARVGACGADPELVRLCLSCLAFQPSGRPGDGGAVAAAVAAHRSGVEARLRQAERERAAAEARAEGEVKRRRLALGLAGLALALLLLAGGLGGWLYLHRQRVTQAAEASLEEAARHADEEKWREALDAAARARDQAADWLVAGETRRRAETAWRGLTLLADLDRLQLLRAEVDVVRNRFDSAPALAGYREAFAAAGWPVEGEAAEAAARLEGVQEKTRARLLEGLYDWWGLAVGAKSPVADWLDAVLDAADGGPWQRDLRRVFRAKERGALLRLVSAADPGLPPGILLRLAAGLKEAKEPTRALALLESLHARHPSHIWVNSAYADALQASDPPRHAEAARVLAMAVAVRPDSAGLWNNLGIALENAGDPTGATRAAETAVRLQPRYAAGHSNLARDLARVGRLAEAEKAARRALELDSSSEHHWRTLAVVLSKMGDKKASAEALASGQRVAHDTPESWESLYHDALAGLDDLNGAGNALRRVLAFKPDYGVGWGNLAVMYGRTGRPLEAFAAAQQATRLAPKRSRAWVHLGQSLRLLRRDEDAAEAFRRAAALDPNDADAQTGLGQILAARKQYTEAAMYFREATRLAPRNALVWEQLRDALEAAGAHGDALVAARECIRLSPGKADHRSLAGLILCDQMKRFDDAAAHFREAIALAPLEPTYQFNLGNALRGGGKPLEAAAAYREAIRLAPEGPVVSSALSNLGLAYLQAGDVGRAIMALERSTAVRPDPATLRLLGQQLAEWAGGLRRAEWAFRAAIAGPAPDARAHTLLANILMEQRRLDEVLALIDARLAAEPNSQEAWMALGRYRRLKGQHAAAAEAFLVAGNAAPLWVSPLQERAVVLSLLGRHEEGADVCRRLIRLKPNEVNYRLNLAAALLDLARPDEAAAALRDAVKDGHGTHEVFTQLGRAYAAARRNGAALEAYRKAARLAPHEADPPYLIAQILEHQKEYAGAMEALKLAYCRAPSSAAILNDLARHCTRAGDRKTALACLHAAVEAAPGFVGAREGLSLALRERGEVKASIRVLREGLKSAPEDLALLTQLSFTQMFDRDGEGAVETARRAVAAHPGDAHSHNALTQAFEFNGQFAEARLSARRAADLNARRPTVLPDIIKQAAAGVEEMARVEGRLPAALRGGARPADPNEAAEFGVVCARKGLNRSALVFFEGLRLGDGGADLPARAAARLARGQDAERPPDAVERSRAARDALGWLARSLPALRRGLESGPPAGRQTAAALLRRWLEADDFAPWREGEAPTKLPAAERSQWQCLWAEMRAVVALAETQGL